MGILSLWKETEFFIIMIPKCLPKVSIIPKKSLSCQRYCLYCYESNYCDLCSVGEDVIVVVYAQLA